MDRPRQSILDGWNGRIIVVVVITIIDITGLGIAICVSIKNKCSQGNFVSFFR